MGIHKPGQHSLLVAVDSYGIAFQGYILAKSVGLANPDDSCAVDGECPVSDYAEV